ncbi:MAG: aminotransferase DegT [Candidatus Aminicenantes bacterium RBG_16_63_16]|nr:MAG: aminotransferase DegT [Candidatus Aminicenantes bacterium RBG_16_63_16]
MKAPQKLAIHGGEKTVKKTFPWPVFDDGDVKAVADVIRSGQWGDSEVSALVARFEREFAAYCGARHAVASANGSVAIRLALIAAGVKPGDEVIIPPYTFIATASVVLEANCVPVFVDIDPDTYNIDPAEIAKAVGPKTRAIIPVHFGGLGCDMDRIMAIGRQRGLAVIEDACHAHGAEYRGRKLGTIGDAGAFSFQSSKNLTSGEGGITITDNPELYEKIGSLRNVGRVKGHQWYDHFNLGCNYRMTTLQAALLLSQLGRLEDQTRLRDENGRYLAKLLGEIDGISPLARGRGETRHSYHLFIFRYDAAKFNNLPKPEFAKWLAAEGVPAFMGYPRPLYQQPLFLEKRFSCYAIPPDVDYSGVHCPVTEKACTDEAVWILQPALLGDRSDMESFAEAVRKIQRHCLS